MIREIVTAGIAAATLGISAAAGSVGLLAVGTIAIALTWLPEVQSGAIANA